MYISEKILIAVKIEYVSTESGAKGAYLKRHRFHDGATNCGHSQIDVYPARHTLLKNNKRRAKYSAPFFGNDSCSDSVPFILRLSLAFPREVLGYQPFLTCSNRLLHVQR